MTIIGVDPGKKGGYAILQNDKFLVRSWDDEKFVDDL